jgi:hypothetical protein
MANGDGRRSEIERQSQSEGRRPIKADRHGCDGASHRQTPAITGGSESEEAAVGMGSARPGDGAWPTPAARDHKGANSAEHVTTNGCRADAYGSAAEFRGTLLFAPGPSDAAWPIILDADPLLAPAIGEIDLWAIARRNLGFPPLVDAIGRRGGMARDLDPTAAAQVKSEVHRIADGLANRLDRLRPVETGLSRWLRCRVAISGAYARASRKLS